MFVITGVTVVDGHTGASLFITDNNCTTLFLLVGGWDEYHAIYGYVCFYHFHETTSMKWTRLYSLDL